MKKPKGQFVRMRTAATDKAKALAQYEELKRDGKVEKALVVTEGRDGAITVLGQMLKPFEIGKLLFAASQALADHDAKMQASERKREPLEPFLSAAGFAGPARKIQEITTAPDGTLVPPDGEHFIGCGECHHSRFYVLLRGRDDAPARYSCAHCGNEIKQIEVFHAEGRA